MREETYCWEGHLIVETDWVWDGESKTVQCVCGEKIRIVYPEKEERNENVDSID